MSESNAAEPTEAEKVLIRNLCGMHVQDFTCAVRGIRAHVASEVAKRTASLQEMGDSVNAIRNSIVGCQSFNFSEHAYPLVAALDKAGFVGEPYPIASKNIGTLIERTNKAEADAAQLRADLSAARKKIEQLERAAVIATAMR